jgi:hypothetical protein
MTTIDVEVLERTPVIIPDAFQPRTQPLQNSAITPANQTGIAGPRPAPNYSSGGHPMPSPNRGSRGVGIGGHNLGHGQRSTNARSATQGTRNAVGQAARSFDAGGMGFDTSAQIVGETLTGFGIGIVEGVSGTRSGYLEYGATKYERGGGEFGKPVGIAIREAATRIPWEEYSKEASKAWEQTKNNGRELLDGLTETARDLKEQLERELEERRPKEEEKEPGRREDDFGIRIEDGERPSGEQERKDNPLEKEEEQPEPTSIEYPLDDSITPPESFTNFPDDWGDWGLDDLESPDPHDNSTVSPNISDLCSNGGFINFIIKRRTINSTDRASGDNSVSETNSEFTGSLAEGSRIVVRSEIFPLSWERREWSVFVDYSHALNFSHRRRFYVVNRWGQSTFIAGTSRGFAIWFKEMPPRTVEGVLQPTEYVYRFTNRTRDSASVEYRISCNTTKIEPRRTDKMKNCCSCDSIRSMLRSLRQTLSVPIVSCDLNAETNKWEPKVEQKEIEIFTLDKKTALGMAELYKSQAEIAVAQCEAKNAKGDKAIALTPDNWQIKVGNDRPQLVVAFGEVEKDGTISHGKWEICIPHYRFGEGHKPNIPAYNRGRHWLRFVLKDNSRLVIHCSSKPECNRLFAALKPLINPAMLTDNVTDGIRPDKIQKRRVAPVFAHYFSKGQRDMHPDWTIRYR